MKLHIRNLAHRSWLHAQGAPKAWRVWGLSLVFTGLGAAAAPPQGTPVRPENLAQQVREAGDRDPEAGLALAKQAIAQVSHAPEGPEYLPLLLAGANLALSLGDYGLAETWADQAANLAALRKDPVREAKALLYLGRIRKYLAKYDAAIADLNKSAALSESLKDLEGQASSAEAIALVLRRIGDFPGAVTYLQKALELGSREGSKMRLTSILNNLGLVQMDLGQLDRARSSFEAGIRSSEGRESAGAHLLENLADLAIREGRDAEAMPYITRSLEMLLRGRRWKSYSSALLTKGILLQRQKRFEEADQVFRKALAMKERIHETFGQTTALIRIGSNDRQRGRLVSAAKMLEKAVGLAQGIRALRLEASANQELSLVYRDQREFEAALRCSQRYSELQEAARAEESRQLLAHLQIRFDLLRREQEILFLKRNVDQRELELRRAKRLRNGILGVTSLALVLAGALYVIFRKERRLREKLVESEAQFRTLAEQAPVGIWILQNQCIHYANREAARIFGQEPSAFVGRDPDEFVQREAQDGPFMGAVARDARGRHLYLELYAGAMNLGGRKAVLETFIDVTQRREVELELTRFRQSLLELVQERTEQLEVAHRELLLRERLSALGRLTATVAHELRNPMGAIRSSLYTIHQGLSSGDSQFMDSALAAAERSTLRCDNLIQELLAYSSPRPLVKEPTEVAAWLGEILDETVLPPGLRIARNFGSCPPLALDRERLRRAVINLVDNAIHAIQGRAGAGCIQVDLACTGDQMEIRITDDGSGIPEQDIPRVFEPLFSTKPFGFGLGLPEVKDVVERHGGILRLESQVGVGTEVVMCLPVGDDTPRAPSLSSGEEVE